VCLAFVYVCLSGSRCLVSAQSYFWWPIFEYHDTKSPRPARLRAPYRGASTTPSISRCRPPAVQLSVHTSAASASARRRLRRAFAAATTRTRETTSCPTACPLRHHHRHPLTCSRLSPQFRARAPTRMRPSQSRPGPHPQPPFLCCLLPTGTTEAYAKSRAIRVSVCLSAGLPQSGPSSVCSNAHTSHRRAPGRKQLPPIIPSHLSRI
jgi:hypothetical protein